MPSPAEAKSVESIVGQAAPIPPDAGPARLDPGTTRSRPSIRPPMAMPEGREVGRDVRSLTYQAAIGIVLAALLIGGFSHLLNQLPEGVDLLFIVLIVFGGLGGVLYAIREGDLVAPRFHRVIPTAAESKGPRDGGMLDGPQYAIRLGWVGDALFGVAGASAIFLLIPGLSENALLTMQEMRARDWYEKNGWESARKAAELQAEARSLQTQAIQIEEEKAHLGPAGEKVTAERALRARARKSLTEAENELGKNPHVGLTTEQNSGGRSGTDFLELVAVALIGGFGGRAVLNQASARLLQKVERAQEELQSEKIRLSHGLEESRANSRAMELVAQQLNPLLTRPDAAALEKALSHASDDGRLRVLDYTAARLETERGNVAPAAIPILSALVQAGSSPRHPFLAILGAAYGYDGDRRRAVQLVDAAIELVKDDESAVAQLKNYQRLRERFSGSRPPERRPHPPTPPKG